MSDEQGRSRWCHCNECQAALRGEGPLLDDDAIEEAMRAGRAWVRAFIDPEAKLTDRAFVEAIVAAYLGGPR